MNKPKLPDGWAYHTRETGLLEAICPCGCGHPVPVKFQDKPKVFNSVHGCCGCCSIFTSVFHENTNEFIPWNSSKRINDVVYEVWHTAKKKDDRVVVFDEEGPMIHQPTTSLPPIRIPTKKLRGWEKVFLRMSDKS